MFTSFVGLASHAGRLIAMTTDGKLIEIKLQGPEHPGPTTWKFLDVLTPDNEVANAER